MSDERWPCQRNPDMWFSGNRRELGRAVHECLSHCTRLPECHEMEARPNGGVLAGVMYVTSDPAKPPVPERRRLQEVPCAGCVFDAKPTTVVETRDTGACGEPKGYHRHIHRGEKPCERCTLAKQEYQRASYRSWRRRAAGWAS